LRRKNHQEGIKGVLASVLVKEKSRMLNVAFYKNQRRKIELTPMVILPLGLMELFRPVWGPK
jgi:hypothetical protein